jgi:hypothetical protein
VAIPEDWTRLWDAAENALGGKIELLLNNAGINPLVKISECDNTIQFGYFSIDFAWLRTSPLMACAITNHTKLCLI